MKSSFFFAVFFFAASITATSIAQSKKAIQPTRITLSSPVKVELTNPSVNKAPSVVHKVTRTVTVTPLKSNGYLSTSNMPWIVALLIGVSTVVINYVIANVNKKTAIRNTESQLNASRIILTEQIDANKAISIAQIKNTQELAEKQFKATINTNNRQKWIDDLRHTLSEFTSQCAILSLEFKNKNTNATRVFSIYEKAVYNRTKAAMLLNADKPEQAQVLNDMKALLNWAFDALEEKPVDHATTEQESKEPSYSELSNALIKSSRQLFKIHWEKIKTINQHS